MKLSCFSQIGYLPVKMVIFTFMLGLALVSEMILTGKERQSECFSTSRGQWCRGNFLSNSKTKVFNPHQRLIKHFSYYII